MLAASFAPPGAAAPAAAQADRTVRVAGAAARSVSPGNSTSARASRVTFQGQDIALPPEGLPGAVGTDLETFMLRWGDK
jgi:hypothetical protein